MRASTAKGSAAHPPTWIPQTGWKPATIDWARVKVGAEEMRRFTERSDLRGLLQSAGFLLVVAATASLAWLAFEARLWLPMAAALYLHGTVYSYFGSALHELSHNTVFRSRALNAGVTALFGLLFWPLNPHFYRLSHQGYHHRYTLHEGSDGEDVPNTVILTPWFFLKPVLGCVQVVALARNLGRLLGIRPTSRGWRDRSLRLDPWESFILEKAGEAERRQVLRFATLSLAVHAAFAATAIATGSWFLVVLVTLAPFYGSVLPLLLAGIHQHAACESNDPDFRRSCGDVRLNPVASFLYWHMEYHVEHHMYAAIPCYRLRAFRSFIEAEVPPREASWPRLLRLNRLCAGRFGSYQAWRDRHGIYKGY